MGNPQAEPSMDEILASIRRIIAEEDDAPKQRTPVREKLETLELTQNEELPKEAVAEEAPQAAEEVAAAKPTLRKKSVAEAIDAIEQSGGAAEVTVESDTGQASAVDAGEVEASAVDAASVESAGGPEHPESKAELEAEGGAPDVAALDEFDAAQTQVETVSTAPKATPEVTAAVINRTIKSADHPAGLADKVEETLDASGISQASTEAAASAFEALSENIRIADGAGQTLEDMVESMLQPLLVRWLDANLPRIVEEKVEEEVRRLSRRR